MATDNGAGTPEKASESVMKKVSGFEIRWVR
jgi:hypothetical protein